MFWNKEVKNLKKEVESLKNEVFPKKEKAETKSVYERLSEMWLGEMWSNQTLVERVKSLEDSKNKEICELKEKVDLLMKHLKLEVQETEKKKFLGKPKKVKKESKTCCVKTSEDCDC